MYKNWTEISEEHTKSQSQRKVRTQPVQLGILDAPTDTPAGIPPPPTLQNTKQIWLLLRTTRTPPLPKPRPGPDSRSPAPAPAPRAAPEARSPSEGLRVRAVRGTGKAPWLPGWRSWPRSGRIRISPSPRAPARLRRLPGSCTLNDAEATRFLDCASCTDHRC